VCCPLQEQKYGAGATGVAERTNAAAGRYAAACVAVGNEAGVPVLDLWSLLQSRDDWRELFVDGLHFNDQGQQAVWAALQQLLDATLPSVRPALCARPGELCCLSAHLRLLLTERLCPNPSHPLNPAKGCGGWRWGRIGSSRPCETRAW
jgi:hypothetical protein